MSVILEDPLTISLIIGVIIILAAYVAVKVHGNRMIEDDDDDDLLMPVDVVYRDITDPVPRSRVQGVGKHEERKHAPIFSGPCTYFPDALWALSECCRAGSLQHHPEKPMHWERSKSGDELDALMRHILAHGKVDDDGIRHSTKVCFRAMANLQKELERAGEAKLSEYNEEKRLKQGLK